MGINERGVIMRDTLFVGHYDFPYGYNAYVFKDKKFKSVKLDVEYHKIINDLDCLLYDGQELTIERLKDFYDADDYEIEKKLKLIRHIFAKYKNIVISADGGFTYVEEEMIKGI